MRTRGGIALAAVLAILVGPACGSSPTAPPPPSACSYQVTAGSNTFGAGGGSTTVTISTGSSCTWSVAVNEVWVTVGTPASGTGPGSVTVNVAPNTTTSTRQCAVTVGGQSIALTQEGQPVVCEFTLEPSFERFDAVGGKDTFEVRTGPACAWTAVSSAPWLEVISGGSGTGPGKVGYEVAAWAGQDERTATIQVGPAVFTLEQEPLVPGACDYSVTPIEFAPCMPATTLTAALTTQQGCSWTAVPDASWITLTSGDSGSGSGVITFRVTDNYDAPRQSVVKVRWPTASAGQNLQVQQAGCLYAVSTESINVPAAGVAPGSFNVYQFSSPNTCGGPLQDACVWTARSDVTWITITTPMPQQGDDPVAFTVAPNTSGASRTGTITVGDKTVRITQAGL